MICPNCGWQLQLTTRLIQSDAIAGTGWCPQCNEDWHVQAVKISVLPVPYTLTDDAEAVIHKVEGGKGGP